MPHIVFLHGLKGSPKGTKATFLKEKFKNCLIPELPEDILIRKEIVRSLIQQPVWLVGSSLGGLSALLFSMENPKLVKAMILLAPAVGINDTSEIDRSYLKEAKSTIIPTKIPTIIIAALRDNIIPLDSIKNLIQRSPDKQKIEYIEVDDEHGLNNSLEILHNSLKKIINNPDKVGS